MKLRLSFDILDLKWILWILVPIMVFHASLTLNVYESMMPLSYLLQFLDILLFLFSFYLFIARPILGRFDFLMVGYIIMMIGITAIASTDLKNMIYTAVDVLFMVILFNYCKEGKMPILLRTFSFSLSVCVYINFIVLISDTSWMIVDDKNLFGYILGDNYNQVVSRIIPAMLCSILTSKYGLLWKINCFATFVTGFLGVLFLGSMTATTGLILFVLFCAIPSISLKRLGVWGMFIFYVFFQIAVCFNGTSLQNNDLAVYIIVDVLGKDITFTHRTELWDAALRVFTESPLFGNGYVDRDWYLSNMSSLAMGPHNLIFYIMISGGIVLLGVFLCLFVMAITRCVKSTESSRRKMNLLFGLAVFLFMQTMEYYPFFFNFLLLSLAYYYAEFNIDKNTHFAISSVSNLIKEDYGKADTID
ncbi:MAG: O-antigen ligase family protein [Bacteroidaceae bacterium]|nr:O-antigen ligase family protein [Bacteroidaceae bacterium]